jgi:hypothetical protein
LFVVIIWEAFVSQRSVQFTFVRRSNLEWRSRFPVSYHTHNKPIKLFGPNHLL